MATSVSTRHPTRPGPADWAAYALIVFFSLVQQVGRTTLDTRVELAERPTSFLAGGFSLWHGTTNFGELLNQAYGYLWPQGPFFVLVELSGMPTWLGQRLWCAVVLLVAYEGARRCARALGFDSGPASLAGLVYTFSPRLLGTVGVISAETLPGAVLPWVVLPILLCARGALGPVRAAVLSGAAVVCMGGVNAVEVIGSLPMPLLIAVWATWRRLVPLRFLVWWSGAMALACTWWLLPLLTLGRFSPPFYEYVESASNTTGVIGWSEALRGASHWVAFITTGGRGWWPAAHAYVVEPALILVAAVVTAIGLLGLVRYRDTMRVPLVAGLGIGLAALTIAHGGWEGSPLSGFFLDALEGPLQVFRNVHKVDPTVRFAVAMGFASAVAEASVLVARRRLPVLRPALVQGLAGILVLVLGQPFLVNDARTPGWDEVPEAWQQAYDFLEQRQDGTTTLVVPGSGFALQQWGWTYDEPMHALGEGVRWTTRSQVPIIPGQSIRVLSAIDRLVSQGEAGRALGPQLARAGVGYVLVRRDLTRGFTDSPPPAGAAQSLATAGFQEVATFGEFADGGREIEIYAVPDRVPRIRSTPTSDVQTVAGAPEAWLSLLDTGLVDPDVSTVNLGEPGWSDDATLVTDTNQRRERAFGRVEEPLSTVLEADEPYRLQRSVPDYPVTPGSAQVVARFEDGVEVRASSSQGYADAYGSVVPQAGPAAAFDGDPDTRWVSSLAGKAREQWLRVRFPSPRAVRQVSVLPVMDDAAMAPIRRLQVRTSAETTSLPTNPTGARVTASLSGERVDWVEVRVTAASTLAERNQLAITDITIDGRSLQRVLVLPEPLDPGDGLLLTGDSGTRACRSTGNLPDCSTARIRNSEEPRGLRRSVEVSAPTDLQLEGLVVARASRATAQLLEPFLSEQQVGATSIYGDDPLVASRFAYDDRADTTWMSSPSDTQPTLFFTWGVERRITGVRLPLGPAVNPGYTRIVLRGADRIERLTVTGELTKLPRPMKVTQLEISFVKDEPDGVVSVPQIDLDGGGIVRPFDPDLPTGTVCGLGPQVVVAGRARQTRVDGTLGDVLSGAPMKLSTCRKKSDDAAVPVTTLDEGRALISTVPTAEFEVVAVSGRPTTTAEPGSRAVEIDSEDDSHVVASVASGPEAVVSVPWNFNTGWEADLDGRRVEPIRVDGWQQAWIVPEGTGGTLTMRFAPQATYTAVLVAGLVVSGLLLLAGLVLLVTRRSGSGPLRASAASASAWRDWPAASAARLPVVAIALVAVVATMGWVAAAAFVVGAAWLRRDLSRLVLLAVVLVVASGVLDAWPLPVPGSVADGLAVAGVGLALALALRGLSPGESRTEEAA
ncbi:alpha-(1-_3)-arabinofuranosyltransferase domain-containing protein [Nocardioides baculatus]|uniref:DUF3367 domain-containing protein n=1 Tax=Nocardioides baculatus TaxID=2801337 RepID=A0ABS1L937_9ACTN|nr:alpha-(1->3)-arabinofuranosyltransferase family protein [Nocardioides baculatus]MBL0748195.1 DUF3367 domain-containing protein [Nocardioides baculatus]